MWAQNWLKRFLARRVFQQPPTISTLDFGDRPSRRACYSGETVKPGIKAQDSLNSMLLHDR